MKLFVVFYPEEGGIGEIVCITSEQEKAIKITEECDDLLFEEYELDVIPTGVYAINIKMDGRITYCKKNYLHEEGVTVNKLNKDIHVYTKAANEKEAVEIAKQKLEEKISRKTVEVIEWKE
jgi:hypothetical protein